MARRTADKPALNLRETIANKADLAGHVIVTLPILVYWIYWTLNPSYWYNGDPAAFYMVDSLSVFDGGGYTYVDHPGTPMQVIGTFFLALTYPFFNSYESFIDFHIARPEAFFLMTHVFLLVTNLATAIIFYRVAKKTLGENRILESISVSILFFTLNPYSFPSLTFWSHNSLNFPFGTLLLLWLFHELQSENGIKRYRLVLMGIAAGILAIAQVYFIVWLATFIFTVFIFTIRKDKKFAPAFSQSMVVLLGGILGILAMLLPIYRELPRFIEWSIQVATHSGAYGTGESGIFPLSLIPTALTVWWNYARPMLIALTLGLAALLLVAILKNRLKFRASPAVYAMTLGILFHIFVLLIPLMKAALKLRYTLSLAATLPILILLILKLSEGIDWKRAVFSRLIFAVVLLGVAVSLNQEIELAGQRAYVEEDALRAHSRAVRLLAKEMNVPEQDLVIVYAFATPLHCSGMLEASNWTGALKEETSAACPNQHAIFDSVVELNTYEPVPGLEDIDWDLVVWPGNNSDLPRYLESVGAVTIPESWRVRRNKWFYIHSEVLNE